MTDNNNNIPKCETMRFKAYDLLSKPYWPLRPLSIYRRDNYIDSWFDEPFQNPDIDIEFDFQETAYGDFHSQSVYYAYRNLEAEILLCKTLLIMDPSTDGSFIIYGLHSGRTTTYCIPHFYKDIQYSVIVHLTDVTQSPPAPPLVGIEPNPGPITKDMHNIVENSNYKRHQSAIRKIKSVSSLRLRRKIAKDFNRLINDYRNSGRTQELHSQGFLNTIVGEPHVSMGLDSNTMEGLEKLIGKFSESMNGEKKIGVEHTFPLIDTFVDNCKKSIGENDKIEIYLVIAIVVLVSLRIKYPSYKLLSLIINGLCGYLLARQFMSGAIVSVKTAMITAILALNAYNFDEGQEIKVNKPQIGIDNLVVKTMITGVLCYLYYAAFQRTGDSFVEDFIKETRHMKKNCESLTFTFDFFSNMVNDFLSKMNENFGTNLKIGGSSLFPELDELEVEIPNTIRSFVEGDFMVNYENSQKLFLLDTRVDRLIAKIPNNADNSHYKRAALYLKAAIKPALTKLAGANIIQSNPRVKPWVCAIAGGSGVGKSTTMEPYIRDLLTFVLNDREMQRFRANQSDFIAYENPSDPYNSGYFRQHTYVWDEFAQRVDVPGVQDNEFLKFMDYANTKHVPIAGASIEDKKGNFFDSKAIILNTNLALINTQTVGSIIKPNAVVNRMNVQWWQTVKKEYCTDATQNLSIYDRKLDVEKALNAPRLDPSHEYSLDVYEFYKYNFGAKNQQQRIVDKVPYSYYDKLRMDAKDYLEHHNRQAKYLHFVSYASDATLKMRQDFRKSLNLVTQMGDSQESEETKAFWEEWATDSRRALLSYGIYPEPYFEWALENKEFEKNIGVLESIRSYYDTIIRPLFSDTLSTLKKMWEIIKSNPVISICVAALAMGGLIYYFFSSSIGAQSEYPIKRHQKMVQPVRSKTFVKGVRTGQGGLYSKNHDDVVKKILRNNLYKFRVKDGAELGYFLFLKERMATTPNHFYFYLENTYKEDPELTIEIWNVFAPGAIIELRYKDLDHAVCASGYHEDTGHSDGDRAYWWFPKQVRNHPDITKFIIDRADPIVLQRFYGGLVYPDSSGNYVPLIMDMMPQRDFQYETIKVDVGVWYKHPTKKGDCGLPVFLMDERHSQLGIVAQHCSGNGFVGYGTSYDVEEVQAAYHYFFLRHPDCARNATIEKLDEDQVLDFVANVSTNPGASVVVGLEAQLSSNPGDNLDLRGSESAVFVKNPGKTIPNHLIPMFIDPLPHTTPSISKIKKTALYEGWGSAKKEPAHLKPFLKGGDIINPMEICRTKVSLPRKAVNQTLLNDIIDQYSKEIFDNSSCDCPLNRKVLTPSEAICGIPGVLQHMSRTTSAGKPLDKYVKKGKTEIFGEDGIYQLDTPWAKVVLDEVSRCDELIRKGIRPYFFFADYLKDERLPKEKVSNGKARLFNGAPLVYSILWRMYFGSFINFMNRNRIHNGSAVGVNPYQEFHLIAQKLKSAGNNNIFMDVSNFDGSTHPAFQYGGLDIANRFYSSASNEEILARLVLWEDVVFSRHIGNFYENVVNVDGKIHFDIETHAFEYNGGTSSGYPGTADFNSINNQLIIRYGFAMCLVNHLTYNGEVLSIEALKKLVIITYGDDSVVSVPKMLLNIDQEKICAELLKIGFTYTPEDKSTTVYKFRGITDGTFLKRRFRLEPELGYIIGALDLEVILEMPYWTKRGAPPGSVHDTVEICLMELAGHGREIFNRESRRIIPCCSEKGYTPQSTRFEYYLSKYSQMDMYY